MNHDIYYNINESDPGTLNRTQFEECVMKSFKISRKSVEIDHSPRFKTPLKTHPVEATIDHPEDIK
jgi:hypothetical protein